MRLVCEAVHTLCANQELIVNVACAVSLDGVDCTQAPLGEVTTGMLQGLFWGSGRYLDCVLCIA